jgi:ribosomal-protein-alanine N-acetyltransferase
MMTKRQSSSLRALGRGDLGAVRRLLQTSDYAYARFTANELPLLLHTRPAVGAFSVPSGPLGRVTGGTLQAFLLLNSLVPPSAWLGGFGVIWSESEHYRSYLDLLLPEVERQAAARGARTLYYSGSDLEADWLLDDLEARDFTLVTTLRSYDKVDHAIPAEGDTQVRVRPFTAEDLPGVLAVEQAAFEPLWRYDGPGFLEVSTLYPYFVVAEDASGIVGYQFNAVDGATGYLVRIAVHPRAGGRGIGTRLMAEAVRYFAREHCQAILLNTEESNHRAHRLYEWFGFHLVHPRGFVLGRAIDQ